jgi:hypothetical protein
VFPTPPRAPARALTLGAGARHDANEQAVATMHDLEAAHLGHPCKRRDQQRLRRLSTV